MMGELFQEAAEYVKTRNPALAAKLRHATTHASHALAPGVELVAVRDNLRHASIATTSAYLLGDDRRRARQVGAAFGRAALRRQCPSMTSRLRLRTAVPEAARVSASVPFRKPFNTSAI